MLNQLDYQQLCHMLKGAIEIIRTNCDALSRLDAEVGDGDHGITMLRAMEKMGEVIDSDQHREISPLLNDISWELMNIDGGATGPLYGSLFFGMAEATTGKDALDCTAFAEMFTGGLTAIENQTKARVGDKTLMDTLIPAVNAMCASAQQGGDLRAMLSAACKAGWRGSEATKDIPARFGRAKYQGDRTIGKPDPGSVSMALVFQGFAAQLEA